jgi:hypothetical protein
MGKIEQSRGLYEYVSDNGIVYEIGENGADFNIIIDTFTDYEERFEKLRPFNCYLVDFVYGDITDPDVIEWIDKRIERYENHERTLRFYSNAPCECYIGLKEEKYETRKRVSKEEMFLINR